MSLTDTSLSSIGFNNLKGGNYGFNQQTGDAALGFTTNLAFFCQLLTIIGFCIFGSMAGYKMIDDSKKYTESASGSIVEINCKEKKERSGGRRSSVTTTQYECQNKIKYKVNGKMYTSYINTNHDFDQKLDLGETRKKIIYYNPSNPTDIMEVVPTKNSGMSVLSSTVVCTILCLFLLNLCYKSLGCKAYLAFDFMFGSKGSGFFSDDY